MLQYCTSQKKNIFAILFFIFLSTAILSPIGSNKHLPANELITHTLGTIQAKVALDQGQFPIRTAPLHQQGWGAAWYQFYSPTSYLMSGLIYKYIVPNNPYLAVKILIWLGIFFAAFYFYLLFVWLIHSPGIGLVAGTVYVFSPYLILNIHSRGDFTEAVSQMILPLVLYYSLRLFFNKKLYFLILASIAWFMLLSTCIITYLYFSLLFAVLLMLIVIQNKTYIKSLIFVGISYIYALILGAYYIVPIGLFEKYLDIHNTLNQFKTFSWLTSLPALFSIKALSPMPLPGNNLLGLSNLYFGIGLPILFGIGFILYSYLNHSNIDKKRSDILILPLLIVFVLAFLLTWTPFDFWSYLPKFLQVAQFSYRLLAQIMWSGTMLFAFALLWLFNYKFDIRSTFLSLILIIVCCSSWIPNQKSAIKVDDLISNPDLGAAPNSYIYQDEIKNDPTIIVTPVNEIEPTCTQNGFKKICHITLTKDSVIQLPVLYYPQMLNIKVNNVPINYISTQYQSFTLASIKLESGNHEIVSYFQGLPWANWISIIGWLSLSVFIFLLLINLGNEYVRKRILQNATHYA